jgi:hypothetical protein
MFFLQRLNTCLKHFKQCIHFFHQQGPMRVIRSGMHTSSFHIAFREANKYCPQLLKLIVEVTENYTLQLHQLVNVFSTPPPDLGVMSPN